MERTQEREYEFDAEKDVRMNRERKDMMCLFVKIIDNSGLIKVIFEFE